LKGWFKSKGWVSGEVAAQRRKKVPICKRCYVDDLPVIVVTTYVADFSAMEKVIAAIADSHTCAPMLQSESHGLSGI